GLCQLLGIDVGATRHCGASSEAAGAMVGSESSGLVVQTLLGARLLPRHEVGGSGVRTVWPGRRRQRIRLDWFDARSVQCPLVRV
ncbi:MAG: hypothetical protein OER95_18365, partial [Acidimicrobiia bacterium]|nr:hypothetical protein [Acidimicrobiia bacterium]